MYNYFLLVGILKGFDKDTKTFKIIVNGELMILSYADIELLDNDIFHQEKPILEKLQESLEKPIGVRGKIINGIDGFDLVVTYIKDFTDFDDMNN